MQQVATEIRVESRSDLQLAARPVLVVSGVAGRRLYNANRDFIVSGHRLAEPGYTHRPGGRS